MPRWYNRRQGGTATMPKHHKPRKPATPAFEVPEGANNLGDAARRHRVPPPPKENRHRSAPAPEHPNAKGEYRKLNRVGSAANPSYGVVLPKRMLADWTSGGVLDAPSSVRVYRHVLAGRPVIVIEPADSGPVVDAGAQARELGEWDPREFEPVPLGVLEAQAYPCGDVETDPDLLEQYRLVDLCPHGCALPCPDCGCGL